MEKLKESFHLFIIITSVIFILVAVLVGLVSFLEWVFSLELPLVLLILIFSITFSIGVGLFFAVIYYIFN